MTEKKRGYGIRKKYLWYTAILLLLALLLSSICVWVYMRRNMTGAIIDKYEFMTVKMGLSLDNLYQKSDEVTADCIVDDAVQKSLLADGLTDVEKNSLSKYFAYIDMEYVAEYCYVDNKENVYTRSYSKITYEDFEESGLADMLGTDYAGTQWIWTEDTLFGAGEPALFIGRYVRSMEYSHEPGMLFLKMNASFFTQVIEGEGESAEEVAAGIVDADGELCTVWLPEGYEIPQEEQDQICALAESTAEGMIVSGRETRNGVLSAYRQGDNGMIVFTFVPNRILNNGLNQVLLALMAIYFVVAVVAVNLSIYFSNRFTKPIRYISEAMSGFDGNDFQNTIELHTNTELDQIGHSYNEMLGNIERLLEEIKEQQKELRTSELNMLISQINPHFLYNTLDTIYMLARINKEETTMKMIQALSKYLRLCLSKGSEMVTLEDELENVKSYMEIQQIRNVNLFRYEIDCRADAEEEQVLKLILQPLVENAVKYGFCDIYEGGLIRITVYEEADALVFQVYNNGKPMTAEMAEKLNGLTGMSVTDMKTCFQDKDHGYGVVNIITRLRLKYGDEIAFYYKTEEDGTCCVIRLPKERGGQDEAETE